MQLINRVGWDGAIKPPDANELGWKDTVRMNPLEDSIVAMRPVAPKAALRRARQRPSCSTRPCRIGSTTGFTERRPATATPIAVTNQLFNFGWEYVWHCHILSHEEMDMMRPMQFNVARALPTAPVLSATGTSGSPVNLTWTDGTPAADPATLGNPANEIGFRIERATGATGGTFSRHRNGAGERDHLCRQHDCCRHDVPLSRRRLQRGRRFDLEHRDGCTSRACGASRTDQPGGDSCRPDQRESP